jgi:hypothetical protein
MNVAATCADGRMASCLVGVQIIVEHPGEADQGRRETVSTAGWHLATWGHELLRRDVSVLLCSGIDQFLHGALHGYGIRVVPNVVGPVDTAIEQSRRGAFRITSGDPGMGPEGNRVRRRFRRGRNR